MKLWQCDPGKYDLSRAGAAISCWSDAGSGDQSVRYGQMCGTALREAIELLVDDFHQGTGILVNTHINVRTYVPTTGENALPNYTKLTNISKHAHATTVKLTSIRPQTMCAWRSKITVEDSSQTQKQWLDLDYEECESGWWRWMLFENRTRSRLSDCCWTSCIYLKREVGRHLRENTSLVNINCNGATMLAYWVMNWKCHAKFEELTNLPNVMHIYQLADRTTARWW